MRWTVIILGSLVGLIALVAIAGALLPRDHVASMTSTIAAPPDRVWSALTDVAAYPSWRSEVQRVEVLSPAPLNWREHTKQGALTLATESMEPQRRMVARIADRNLPFGGAWEYAIAPDGADSAKTRVTITERGYVSNPIFRFVSRFAIGHYSTLDAYLRALSRKFGAEVTPQRV